MKSSIKKISALLTMMAVAILTFTFTACSDDDDPVTEVTYTYGFSSMSASHPDFLEEMGKIENAFLSALGITGKLSLMCSAIGCTYVDCPFTGSRLPAEKGELVDISVSK